MCGTHQRGVFDSGAKVAGLAQDVAMANTGVWRWLYDVANRHQHGTTHETPAKRLILVRTQHQPLPTPYRGAPMCRADEDSAPKVIVPVESLQHPLSVYDQLLWLWDGPST